MKLLNSEHFTPSVLVLLIILFSVLLYKDLTRRIDFGNRKVIGTLKYKEKVTQRKFDGQVIWEVVDKDIPITNRDSIRTADLSSAVIELEDKTEIKLEENSMIVLDFTESNINIDFAYGSLSANRADSEASGNSTLNIKSGEKVIELQKTDVKVGKTEDGNLDMTVEKGNATIKSDAKEQVVEKDQILTVKENIIEVKPVSVKPISPADNVVLFTKSDLTGVSFNWEVSDSAADVQLVIAADHKFSKSVQAIKVNGKSTVQPLKDGTFYWKISAKDAKGGRVDSEVRKFIQQKEEIIKLFYPIDKSRFSYMTTPPVINISWTKSAFATAYKIEISQDKDFGSILQTMTAITHKFAIDNLQEGNYYIRVTTKPASSSISPITSNANFFSVDKKRVLPVPEVKYESASVSAPVLEKGGYVLNWKDSPEYKSYEVQIAQDQEFKKVLQEAKSERNFFAPDKKLQKGRYFWRVKGIAGDGEASDYSVSALEVRDPIPLQVISPVSGSFFSLTPSESVVFRWSKPDAYGTFKLEFSDREDFSNILRTETATSLNTSLSGFSPGKYFYRLLLLDSKNEELMKSNTLYFTINAALTAPVLTYPVKNANVDMTDIDELKLQWEPIPDAISYKLELYQKTGKQDKLILQEEVKGDRFSVKDMSLLDEGRFMWKLYAKVSSPDANGKITPAATENFIISLKTTPGQPPVIVTPEEQIKE